MLDGVARTYPGDPPTAALAPTSLTIRRGEFVSVVGPSGSGKSTLLNLLGLLDAPTTGRYFLSGRETSHLTETQRTMARSRAIGFVFQASHLVSYRTAFENVELGLLYQGVPRATRLQASIQALQQVGLADRIRATPDTLSGGERQRVAIARALATSPEVLLCDEPTGNLDTDNTSLILDLLDALNRQGVTIIVITHDPNVAVRAHRTVALKDGQVIADQP